MRTLILEDENLSAEFLEKMINDNLEDCQVVGRATSVKEVSKLYHSLKPDVMFMDINLGDHLSFELFDYIDSNQLQVIFTTGYQEYAVKAFKVDAIDYLMKPINLEELVIAVSKAKERLLSKELNEQKTLSNKEKDMTGLLLVWENNKLRPVKIDEIIKIKADGPYSRIYFIGGKNIFTSKSLGVYESLLMDWGFFRIHHSCLINPAHLVSFKPGIRAFVTLKDQKLEAVSRSKKNDLMKVMKLPLT